MECLLLFRSEKLVVMKNTITIEAFIAASPAQVWQSLTMPEHITKWNHASDNWASPRAENDLRPAGRFNYRMESLDSKDGFDFSGIFSRVVPGRHLDYTLNDGRKVTTTLSPEAGGTKVIETFEADDVYSPEQQRQGWQAILDNLKKHAESLK